MACHMNFVQSTNLRNLTSRLRVPGGPPGGGMPGGIPGGLRLGSAAPSNLLKENRLTVMNDDDLPSYDLGIAW